MGEIASACVKCAQCVGKHMSVCEGLTAHTGEVSKAIVESCQCREVPSQDIVIRGRCVSVCVGEKIILKSLSNYFEMAGQVKSSVNKNLLLLPAHVQSVFRVILYFRKIEVRYRRFGCAR